MHVYPALIHTTNTFNFKIRLYNPGSHLLLNTDLSFIIVEVLVFFALSHIHYIDFMYCVFHVCVCVCTSCQTEPCEECEYQGHTHAVGDRWKGSNCQLCHCLSNLKVQCAPFCPYTTTGCPQVCLCVIFKQSPLK